MNQGSAMIRIVDFKSKQEPRFEERKKYSKIHKIEIDDLFEIVGALMDCN